MLEIVLTALLVGFASYRATRFLIFDTLIEQSREKFYVFLINRKHLRPLWDKVLDLTSCTWCLGFWVGLAAFSFLTSTYPWDFTRLQAIATFAIAGVQGLLHTVEPEEDHEH